MTQHSLDWFPHVYGGDKVRRVMLEPRVGGRHYEDTSYELTQETGGVRVRVTKLAVGPMTEEEAAGIAEFGDFSGSAAAIEKLAAG